VHSAERTTLFRLLTKRLGTAWFACSIDPSGVNEHSLEGKKKKKRVLCFIMTHHCMNRGHRFRQNTVLFPFGPDTLPIDSNATLYRNKTVADVFSQLWMCLPETLQMM